MKPLHHQSATTLHKLFVTGESSAVAITEAFLDHVGRIDHQVGAFLAVLGERALTKARALDQKRAQKAPLGKLAGVPVALKDIIHIKHEVTTCASRFLANYKAGFDATVTRLLEEQDAIIIGKTNLDEFAMGSSTENSAYQLTRNPWNLECVPGGSSGGSAAAVSAFMAPVAIGTDTGGSIRQPASFCGVVGFKPTYGRVSRYGVVAFASSLDHIGPFANTVHDIATVMQVIGKPCAHDATSVPNAPETYTEEEHKGVKGMTIGVPWHFLEGLEEGAMTNFRESLDRLVACGAKLVDVNLDILSYSIPLYYILSSAEASTNLARFDGIRYGHRSREAKTLADIYELSKEEGFGREVKRRILLGTYVLASSQKELFYKKAQAVRGRLVRDFAHIFARADLIAIPTSPTTAFKIGSVQDPLQMYLSDIYTIGANMTGMPAISLPSGLDENGMPYSLQLIGPQLHDNVVLRAGYAFEKASPFKRPPMVEV